MLQLYNFAMHKILVKHSLVHCRLERTAMWEDEHYKYYAYAMIMSKANSPGANVTQDDDVYIQSKRLSHD